MNITPEVQKLTEENQKELITWIDAMKAAGSQADYQDMVTVFFLTKLATLQIEINRLSLEVEQQ